MRKQLFMIIGLMFTMNAFSQSYYPIPVDSVYWVELHQGPYLGGTSCIQSSYDYIYPAGSIVIGGLTYTEFHARTVVKYDHFGPPPSTCPPTGDVYPDHLYAFIRNDSANKKVWLYDTSTTQADLLLYDFDIATGDTVTLLNGYNQVCSYDTCIVANIDSVNIGGTFRKRFEMNSYMAWDTIFLIEGIGSNYGLAFNQYCPFEYTSNLICYHYKQFEYGDVNSAYCTNTLNIEDEIVNVFSIVKPLGSDQFEIMNAENQNIDIACYDISGKFILQKAFHESGYLNFSQVSTGVYVMYITIDGQNIKPYKFIITH